MPPEEKSSLGRLEEKLYSSSQSAAVETPHLSVHRPKVAPDMADHWEPPKVKPHKRISIAVWFLIGASIFTLIAMGIAAFFLFTGVRMVSNNNIDIKFTQGPASIASGTAVPLTITVKNSNPAQIINTSITINFPEGTRSATDMTQEMPVYTDTLGSIPSGASVSKTVQAVLFGSVNQTLTIPVTFQYRTANSNQILTKQQDYSFTITSSPLTITAQTVPSVALGQPFSIKVAVRSNATAAMNTIAISAQYPSGFVSDSQSAATTTGPLITIGTLKPGEEKDITLTGSLTGTQNDQRNFGFTVGTPADDGSPTLSVAYATAQTTVAVTQPFLAATLALNNDSGDPLTVSPEQPIAGLISWTNTLTSGITNGQITLRLSGSAISPSDTTAMNGSYDAAHSLIVFTRDTESSLAHLAAGASGKGNFTIGLKTGTAFTSLRNPSIQLSVGVAGTPDGSSRQSITSIFTRTIKISTDLVLSSSLLHSSGPIPNSGLMPPQADQTTTYTVMLNATNDVNDIAGATATMILPSYVTYTGQTNVSNGTLTYDDATRMVTWKIGDIPAGTVKTPLRAAFQVSLQPDSSQVGQAPIVLQNQTISGTDRFTNSTIQYTANALTTASVSDPNFQQAFGTVTN